LSSSTISIIDQTIPNSNLHTTSASTSTSTMPMIITTDQSLSSHKEFTVSLNPSALSDSIYQHPFIDLCSDPTSKTATASTTIETNHFPLHVPQQHQTLSSSQPNESQSVNIQSLTPLTNDPKFKQTESISYLTSHSVQNYGMPQEPGTSFRSLSFTFIFTKHTHIHTH
jgi:hypothetical protein